MQRIRQVAVCFLVLMTLVACSGEPVADTGQAGSGGKATASDFPFMGAAELDAYLKQNAGKPTLLMFWATWCPSCKQELPELAQLQETHGDQVNVITVSMDDKVEALEKFYSDGKPEVQTFHGDHDLARQFGVEAIPTLVLFDGQGEPVFARPGVFPHEMLVILIEKATQQ